MDMNNGQYYWWKENSKELHKSVFQYIKFLDNNQSYRQSDNIRFMKLYGNYELLSLKAFSYQRNETSYNISNRVTLNIIQSMVDTVTSKITKNKPKPTFLTDGGDWSLQQKAKKLEKFVEGQFYDCDFYELGAQAFRDSCIFGTGAIKIFPDMETGKIKAERVFIDEIVTDDGESIYGNPRQMHQKKWMHKDVLKEMFPEHSGAIDMASDSNTNLYQTDFRSRVNDMILVIESWHLPSSASAKDGKHSISISNETLWEEEYKKSYFPFVFFRWGVKPLGFYGQGLSEQLQGIQLEINKILRTIQVSMHLVSVPKLLIEAGSKIVTSHLNNKIGGIIKYAGTRPEYAPLGGIPAELFSHLDRLYTRAYEIAGISQLSAQSAKPTGLNSGKALREYNDIETERFMDVGLRYQQTFIKAAEIMVDQASDLYEELGEYKIRVKGKGFIETIDWSEVDMEEDKYMMEIFPTSALSNTPAGRLQDVQELLQAGFISKEDGLKLLDFPDLNNFYNLANASVENIEKTIEKIVDDGEYNTPEPYQDLTYGMRKMQEAYLHYKNLNLSDERLDLFRRWIEDANAMMIRSQQPTAPVAAPGQEVPLPGDEMLPPEENPLAVPEGPPTSDLLPIG